MNKEPKDMDDRKQLLLKMYDQMFADIDKHITVVWQSIGTVIGAFALLALVEKQVVTIDVAISLIAILCAWLMANLLDAGYWYNRNLVIIANIEKQFLLQSDLREIQYYFGSHRPRNKMITHMKIQMALGVAILVLVILYHLFTRVIPGLSSPFSDFEAQRTLPYLALAASGIYLRRLRDQRDRSYQEFLQNSPGINVDTNGIKFGVGHGQGS